MATVWITQEMPGFNYVPAEEYGEVKFITARDLNYAPNSLIDKQIAADVKAAMRQFDPETDYLAPTGSPVVAMMAAVALGKRVNKFRVLKWNNRRYEYIPFELEV